MDKIPPIPPGSPWSAKVKQPSRILTRPIFVPDQPVRPPVEFTPESLGLIPAQSSAPPEAPGLTPRQVEHARALIAEAQRRSIEALRLYEPLPSQLAFHLSMARQRISRGSNRSGKTTVTLAELAMAVTGQHYQRDKYPLENGRAIVVAKDLDKIGEVIWRKLGRAGAFQMVRDPVTMQWRAFRPATDSGLKSKPAQPLIPPRMIKKDGISWESKKAGIPKKVIMKNGWEINFYSSKSDPFTIQGTDLDLVLFDEEIVHHDWFPEAITRLIDHNGWFLWSATPQTGTQQLYDLHLRAEAWQEELELQAQSSARVPPVSEHFMSVFDNPHIPAKARDEWIDSLDEDQRRVRVQGEFAISGIKIYDAYFFPRGIHGVEPFPVPESWTRFAMIDPGAQVCAVLFAACPPLKAPTDPEVDASLYGDFVYFYDEIYLRQCDARKLADRMLAKIGGQAIYEFVIDHHGGRLTEIGSGKTPEQQYREAFRAAGVKSTKTGHGFTWGSDDVAGRILRTKEFMRVRADGTAKLRFLRGACPKAVDELARYQWKVQNGEITEKPLKRNDHQCDNVGYAVMLPSLRYHKPAPKAGKDGSAYDSFLAWKKQEKKRKAKTQGTGVTLG